MCVSCWSQGIQQGAAAGSTSAALGLIAAGLSNIGLRGLADRLLIARVAWITPRRAKLAAGIVALGVLVAVMGLLTQPTTPY